MDDQPRRKYRAGPDWHRIVFASSLLVALLLIALSAASKDGQIANLLDPGGRDQMRRILIVHHPDIARWLRLGPLNATPYAKP